MPAVFVHGNPETDAIWGLLVAELTRTDVVLLSPPGFGAPVPEGWGATRAEYLAWLIAELEAIDEPVDLVGHDWGALHVMAVAMARPDLLRSWASDALGVFDPEYIWHDMAQTWQSPAGEDAIAAMIGAPLADRTTLFASLGLGEQVAAEVAAALDDTMGRCILALYRSAAQPVMAEAGRQLEAAAVRPGLAIIPSGDPYTGGVELARRAGVRAGADLQVLTGRGHWWMLEDPAGGAGLLESFWSAAAAR